jgi:putative tryptophan/tyrosine transport system substrate-binding protein
MTTRPRPALRLLLGAAALALAACGGGGPKVPTVGLLYFGPDPLTERSIRGIRDGLREAGFEDGKGVRIVTTDAQGDMSLIQPSAKRYVAQGVDVMVPLGSPVLVGAANAAKGTGQKIVFAQVFNPYATGVAKSPTDHPPNLTCVASPPPIGGVLDLMRELIPRLSRVGTLYNPGEPNSAFALEVGRREAQKRGLTLVERTVSSSGEVQQAAQSLAGQAQAIVVFGDHTVFSAFESVGAVAAGQRMPLFTAIPMAGRGSVADLGPDFYESGRIAGGMIARVLRGARPADMNIQEVRAQYLSVDLGAAAKQGLKIPEPVVARAKQVLGR